MKTRLSRLRRRRYQHPSGISELRLEERKKRELAEENERLQARVAELEAENAGLRARIPVEPEGDLSEKTLEVLVYLFRADHDARDVGAMARNLEMERSEAEYYLERLGERGLARGTGGNYVTGQVFWNLTAEGRRYVVDNELNARDG